MFNKSMNFKDTILISDVNYDILYSEHEIIQPEYFNIAPTWSDDTTFAFISQYNLEDYQLYLKNLIVSNDRGYPEINGIDPKPYCIEQDMDAVQYNDIMEAVEYTGAMVIGTHIVKNYSENDDIPCYSYKCVKELVFLDGKLITTIDHSKAMLRVRKNLDLGLRSLNKKSDVKCIQRFIMSSFSGNYKKADKRYQKLLKKFLHRKSYYENLKKKIQKYKKS